VIDIVATSFWTNPDLRYTSLASARTGYTAEWVNRLKWGFKQHLPGNWKFVCLTNETDGFDGDVERIPFEGPPGWWNITQLMSPEITKGRMMFCGLDTVVVGDLGGIAALDHPFMLPNPVANRFNNGFCVWRQRAVRSLWDAYREWGVEPDPVEVPWRVAGKPSEMLFWIRTFGRPNIGRLGVDLAPHQVVSYKLQYRKKPGFYRRKARVVYFQGRLTPHLLMGEKWPNDVSSS